MAGDWDGELDRRRSLLRQLRDLDDDLAAGKLTEEDHQRLREPIEHEAAVSLTRRRTATATRGRQAGDPDHRPGGTDSDSDSGRADSGGTGGPDGTGAAAPGRSGGGLAAAAGLRRRPAGRTAARRHEPAATARRGPRPSRTRRLLLVVLAIAAVAGVSAALAGAITPRGAGQTVTGSGPAAAATPPPVGPTAGSAAAPADPSAGSSPSMTPEQAAAIDAAALDVKAHPRDVDKHLALAHAYADGGATQLAAVEYLAILKLDPGNAEANTAMALLAFEVGQPGQARTMLDAVLRTHPGYPEALYVRGLVLLSGLHQPAAATKDLRAYLAAAPYGSHRTAAETLLALAGSQK
jgi:tetratricopeptide (TPR) repeat protein